ncbi:hypothetical protein RUM44_002253 [Polyplax serrata]|uniref:Uncharacterized protein n=1 Tax=Polyplax serrata TaxID=468196 RepID=A0ABR1AMC0_POLSC
MVVDVHQVNKSERLFVVILTEYLITCGQRNPAVSGDSEKNGKERCSKNPLKALRYDITAVKISRIKIYVRIRALTRNPVRVVQEGWGQETK